VCDAHDPAQIRQHGHRCDGHRLDDTGPDREHPDRAGERTLHPSVDTSDVTAETPDGAGDTAA